MVERKGFKMLVKKLKAIYSIPGRNEVLVPILWKCPSFTYNINGAAWKLQAWKTPFSIFYFIIRNIAIANFLDIYHPPSLALLNVFPTVSYHRHTTTFFTHRCQATGAFTYCCTAANQTDDEEKSSDSYDYNSWNQRVHIFKEVVIVIICDKHISSNVA